MNRIVGISLKSYLDPDTTRAWLEQVAAMRMPSGVDVVVFPETTLLAESVPILQSSGIFVGAQDVSRHKPGAHTGEVPAEHLAALNVRYVEVGHVERRTFGDDAQIVAVKAQSAFEAGLIPWLCVSQPSEAYDAGGVVAYEPVSAIGAEHAAPASDVLRAIKEIRERLPAGTPVLYGGSAGPGTFTKYQGLIDGLFLGRFGHQPQAFLQVVNEVADLPSRKHK